MTSALCYPRLLSSGLRGPLMKSHRPARRQSFLRRIEGVAIFIFGIFAIGASIFDSDNTRLLLPVLFLAVSMILVSLVRNRDSLDTLENTTSTLQSSIEKFNSLSISNVIDAGIFNAYNSFSQVGLDDFFDRTNERIRILQTWFPTADPFPPAFIRAVKRGVFVDILLLDPASEVAKQRLRDFHRSEQSPLPNLSVETIYSVLDRNRCPTDKVTIRYYRNVPPFSMYAADDRMLMGFYWLYAGSTAGPNIEIRSESSIFSVYINRTFQHIWNGATDIDRPPHAQPLLAGKFQSQLARLTRNQRSVYDT